MIGSNFHKYLINLGFSEKEILSSLSENVFSYSPYGQVPLVKYIVVKSEIELYNQHLKLWNQNSDCVFIAVDSDRTHIIDAKKKPKPNAVLGTSVCIKSFDYGINSAGFKDIDVEIISKNHIDSASFYHFVQQKQRKKEEVDKDLLLNLIALRNDLINENNEQIIHLLILRCLFVKYLEDRSIFEYDFLPNILKSKSSRNLISAFNEVCKINGDVFGSNRLSEEDIKVEYLDKLYLFFSTDYQSGQGTLFPYQFDNIPIQLISHVYEAFLKNDTKRGKGIYYTPSFVVNFMLSQSLKARAQENPQMKVLDPAVGSGAFLVESFKILRDALSKKYERRLSYEEKKYILENQLYGIDNDKDALQISAFSLYLALLEDESPEFIRHEIEYSNPILPSLIGSNLMNANTLVDHVFENIKFDFIVSNPPWGSVPTGTDKENIAEREAIDNKSGAYPEYNCVADYERSQAFLRRVERWQKSDTLTVMIVKNSIFLNDKTENFRYDFLEKNQIETFFELSHYNKILFKKKVIGKIRGKEPVEIGANEPCAIVIYKPNRNNTDYKINYISPKLTKLGEHFELIQYTTNELFHVRKNEFLENDRLWRILVNGDIESFRLISKLSSQKDVIVESRVGFQPSKTRELYGDPQLKKLIEPTDFIRYIQNMELSDFNWNQKVRRRTDGNVFKGRRLIFPVRPLKSDNILIRGILLDDEVLHKDNIISIKLKNLNNSIFKFSLGYLGLLNSKLFSFFFYQISSQWGKGEGKRESIRNIDTQNLPFKKIDDHILKKLDLLTKDIIEKKSKSINSENLESNLDELIFDLYELTEYEKEIIEEFYQISVDRADEKLSNVQSRDIIEYFNIFKDTFSLVLSPNHAINASYNISQNFGAIIKIAVEEKGAEKELAKDNTLQILQFVNNKQLFETDKLLKDEKIKIYEPKHFYLIKSNQFKDWTKRQAYKDAKEEIDLLLSNLPDSNE